MSTSLKTLDERPLKHPDFRNRLSFAFRSTGLKLLRIARNARQPIARGCRNHSLDFPFLIGESKTPLRSHREDRERAFEDGKIQNLKVACEKLNRLEFKAGEIFSFWKSLGPAWSSRGYVIGREIREGCLIPTIGGGLCQISGSLFEAASQAQFEIVERHKHSRRLPGVEYVAARDATVFWNYVDLRFRATTHFVLKTRLHEDALIVEIWAQKPLAKNEGSIFAPSVETPPASDCLTCEKVTCSTHLRTRESTNSLGLLLHEMPEYSSHYSSSFTSSHSPLVRLRSALASRNPFGPRVAASLSLMRARWTAGASAPRIRRHAGPLVIAQPLLPHLWQLGLLQGRDYTVILTYLPLGLMHKRLDEAQKLYPSTNTLSEFRVESNLVQLEVLALSSAKGFLTTHAELATLFPTAKQLPVVRASKVCRRQPELILFPGPVAEREGASVVRDLARKTGFAVFVRGPHLEGAHFWNGVRVVRDTIIPWEKVACVVHPTIFEARPEIHLQALAREIPVIGTSGCGLDKQFSFHKVEFGDLNEVVRIFSQIIGAPRE